MDARRKIAVAGATGRLGRQVVEVLEARGHDVVRMSRSSGVDVVTGDGLDAALTGVEAIIDAATGPSPDEQAATDFFTTAARNLHAAGARAGVQRMAVVSIIGIDRFTGGYSAAKIAHEQAMLAGPVPVRVLRAAQFHEFVAQLVDWGRQGDVSYVQKMNIQPVAASAVAQVLADITTQADWTPDSTGGPFAEVAGPQEENLVDLAKLHAARSDEALTIEGVSDPANPDSELYESGALLPGPDAILAGPTFEEWLDTN
jgi:uncharacterized protein YbjT (DUF2867 family)